MKILKRFGLSKSPYGTPTRNLKRFVKPLPRRIHDSLFLYIFVIKL